MAASISKILKNEMLPVTILLRYLENHFEAWF